MTVLEELFSGDEARAAAALEAIGDESSRPSWTRWPPATPTRAGGRYAPSPASPAWPARVAAAHTLPRELQAQERYRFTAERFKGLDTPTLLLVGGDSPFFFKAAAEVVAAALPNSRIVVLPGQQHIAMDTAPDLFVREVIAFWKEPA